MWQFFSKFTADFKLYVLYEYEKIFVSIGNVGGF